MNNVVNVQEKRIVSVSHPSLTTAATIMRGPIRARPMLEPAFLLLGLQGCCCLLSRFLFPLAAHRES
jgi:hypothetical protein